MADREKVIKALTICSKTEWCENNTDCPYFDSEKELHFEDCKQMLKDALELLKEQDKTIESLTKEKERFLLERIAELQHNIDALHVTMQDVILVNNAIEQRKAVKWNE